MDEQTIAVRPATGADDIDALAVDDPNAPWYRLWQEWDSEELSAIWLVATADDAPVGVAGVVPAGLASGGAGPALLTVRREHRRRGVGTALRAGLEAAARSSVPAVCYRIIEGTPGSEAAVDAWGLGRGPTHSESVLDLVAVDRDRYARKATVPDVEIESLPDLSTLTEEEWQALHAFVAARNLETPDAEGSTAEIPYAVFRSMVQEPWMMGTARVDGELVGITYVTRRPGSRDVNTMLTGVVPEFRGRGIASALKCAQALMMAELGVPRLYTQNQEGNEPILAANRTLGFVHHRTEVEIRVPLDS